MTMCEHQTDDLDLAFAAARSEAMRPVPEALLARTLGDAEAELAWRKARTPARGGLRALLAGLGGWPGIGGLTTAAAVGLWIGVAMPSAVQNLGLPLASEDEDVLTLLLPEYTLAAAWEG
jgi:hypothetical protein